MLIKTQCYYIWRSCFKLPLKISQKKKKNIKPLEKYMLENFKMFHPTRFLVACGIHKNYVKKFEGLIYKVFFNRTHTQKENPQDQVSDF